MCWVSKKGRAAKMHTTTQLLTVSRYMSLGRRCTCSGRPGMTNANPAIKVIRLAHRNEGRSLVRSKITRVAIGITMATARVIRKMPMMKPMMRRVGNAMKFARVIGQRRHSTRGAGLVNRGLRVDGEPLWELACQPAYIHLTPRNPMWELACLRWRCVSYRLVD